MYKIKNFTLLKLLAAVTIAASVFFCFTCATAGASYGGFDSNEAIPSMQELRQGTLPNGLRYYIYENHKPEDRACLTLAVDAGAVLEDDDENGLAHFVEHMAFNGTERFSGSAVVDYLRSLGMRFGADVNAYTTADSTVYGIEVPVELDSAGVKHIPAKALDIIEDWTNAVTFAPEAVNDERRVIMEEYRLRRLGASGRMQKLLWTNLLSGSRYADRDVIGLPDIIENTPAEILKNFYKKWYRPENMAVIFAGDFDGAALEDGLLSRFDTPVNGAPFIHPEYSLPPPEKNNINVEISIDPELQYTQAVFFYKQNYIKNRNTIAEYREDLINNLISKMFSERFEDEILNPKSPFAAAAADFMEMVRPSRFYTMNLVSKPGMTEQAIDEMMLMKESARRYGFTNTEIERAKKSLLSDVVKLTAEKEKMESLVFIRKLTSHYLDGASIPDFDWEQDMTEKLLPGITKNDIHKAVKNYFLHNDIFIFIAAPEAESLTIPSEDAIVKKVKASGSLKVNKPGDAVFDSELMDKRPERGSIDEEIIHEDTGIVEWKLSNGARVLLKSTANKNDEVEFYALAHGGMTAAPLEDVMSAGAAAELFSASGIGRWPLRELNKKLSGKQISISLNAGEFTRSIEGWSSVSDMKSWFELLYLIFTEPSIKPEAFSVIVDEYRTLLSQRSQDPEAVFFDEMKKIKFGGNPRFMPPTVDDISKIDAERAFAFIKKCLNPADYTFVITGNANPENVMGLVETYIASIPETEKFDLVPPLSPPIQRPAKSDFVIHKGKENKSYVYSGRFISQTFDEKTAVVCLALAEYLDITLVESIREKLGGVYTINASASVSPFPPDGELYFGTLFICDPNRAVELNEAVEAELAKIAAGNINADTFEKARKALIKNWEQSMQSNKYLSRTLANYDVIFNIPAERLFNRPDAIEALTSADVQNLMKQILRRGAVTMMMYPEEQPL